MHYSALALGAFLISSPAHAVTSCPADSVIGQTCTQLGATEMSSDCTNVAGCFYSDATQKAMVWKAQYGGSGGSFAIQSDTISSAMAAISGATQPVASCPSPNPMTGYCNCAAGYAPAAIGSPGVGSTTAGTGVISFTCVQGKPTSPQGSGRWFATSTYWTGGVQCNVVPSPVTQPDGGTGVT